LALQRSDRKGGRLPVLIPSHVPVVSVVNPAFNAARDTRDALGSVYGQTFGDYEDLRE